MSPIEYGKSSGTVPPKLGHTLRTVIKSLKLRVHMCVAGPTGRPWLRHRPIAVMKPSYMCENGHPGLGSDDWQAGGSGQRPAS